MFTIVFTHYQRLYNDVSFSASAVLGPIATFLGIHKTFNLNKKEQTEGEVPFKLLFRKEVSPGVPPASTPLLRKNFRPGSRTWARAGELGEEASQGIRFPQQISSI